MLNDHRTWLRSCGKIGKLADFNGWNLDNANLELVDLSFALLNNVSLKNANLWGARFANAELNSADLEGAKILGGNFSGAQCEGTNFAYANLEDANLEDANLHKTNFTGASLRRAKFKGANISSSNMIDAYLEVTDFRGATIEATNFKGANIDDANFKETHRKALNIKNDLPNAKFKDDTMPNLQLSKTTSSEVGTKNHESDMVTLNRTSNIKSAKEDLIVDLIAVDPAIMEAALNDLMEKVKSNIQFDQLKALCKQQHFIESIDNIEFKKGDFVMYDGQVAFKLDYTITYDLGLLVDRKGKFINVFWSTKRQKEK